MTNSATTKDAGVRPCPATDLQQLEGQLFSKSCDVKITEHADRDAARAYVAEVLAGSDLELEPLRLATDHAVNAAKATPEYFAPSDLFSLSQQNRGVL